MHWINKKQGIYTYYRECEANYSEISNDSGLSDNFPIANSSIII